jgi:diguanylate cyclase (GGDEF)-like protein
MTYFSNEGTVLIVDDTPQNIHVLMEAMEENCRVQAAKSGEEALRKVREDTPDLILLDVMMPGMDGFEVCRRLKRDDATKNIPVIFVTAVTDNEHEEKGLKLGAIDYIRKPFHIPIVRVRIQNHLRLKRKSDLLEQLVRIDGLTDICNRRGLDEALDREWKRCQRHGTSLALIMLDIDHFKVFNDTYGHAEGDACLARVARTVSLSLNRSTDLAARYGGEEFAVLLPETPLAAAREIAETIRRKVQGLSIEHVCGENCVTISLGAACLRPHQQDGEGPEELIRLADQALYQAKSQGRNRVCLAEGGHDETI